MRELMLILTFTCGANRYGLDTAYVAGVIPRVELCPIPCAADYMAGLLRYRTDVVPVIDLGVLLGAGPCANRLSTRIILVKSVRDDHNRGKQEKRDSVAALGRSHELEVEDQKLLGLVAENVSDLSYVSPGQISSARVRVTCAPYLDATVQLEHEIVQLVAVEKLRESALSAAPLHQDLTVSHQPSVSAIGGESGM